MLNQVILVGRLTGDVEVNETENGKKVASVNIAVARSYKNMDGTYDTDFIRCILWNGVAENTSTYCKKGDLVAIKGRIQTGSYENENGKCYVTDVIAEKVIFINNSKKVGE